MTLVITNCPACSKPTRVPADRGRIRVTCPTCAHRWSYPDTAATTPVVRETMRPIVVETAAITMRCSIHGQAYHVNFTRPNPGVCFTIRDIGLIQTYEHVVLQRGPRPHSETAHGGVQINLSDLSFHGFQCPSCAVLGSAKRWQFIRCGVCTQLICTGSLQTDDTFRCVCGNTGHIDVSLPPITAIDGTTRREATAAPRREPSRRETAVVSRPESPLLSAPPKPGLLR